MFYLLNISTPSWKRYLSVNNRDYLPVVPIFQLVTPNKTDFHYFADALTYGNDTLEISSIINELNSKKNVEENIEKVKELCDFNKSGKACLLYGRIHEFGSYNITENITTAYNYYIKAQSLNETSALSMLSFYHKYFEKDIESSIIEADASREYIESLIPTSIQHYDGKYRPLSCPAAANDLLEVSEAIATMNDVLFHSQPEINESEYERLTKSRNAKDMYTLAIYKLSEPYPDKTTFRAAEKLLNKSYRHGYTQAGAPLSRLKIMNSEEDGFPLLKKYVEIDDPIANYVMSDVTSVAVTNADLQMYGLNCLKKAVSVNSLPAINKLAELTYYGLYGIPRSAKNAYKIYLKGAVLGYKRSIYKTAVMLLGGDGVTVDCPRSVENLRKLSDLGPWSTFLDRYVERGSEIAYLKMVDLGLTPCKIIATNRTSGYSNADKTDEYLSYVRKARNGDDESIVWLALKSPLCEVEGYLLKLRQLKITSSMLEYPIRAYLLYKNFIPWMRGELKPSDAEFIESHFSSLKIYFVFTASFASLMLLIISRVRIILE